MVNVWAVPVQVGEAPIVGVTVIVAEIGAEPVFVGVNEPILPIPLAAKPIAGLLFDQLNVALAVPVNAGTLDAAPLQKV